MNLLTSLGGSFGSFRPGQVIEVDDMASILDYQSPQMSAAHYAELQRRHFDTKYEYGRCVRCGDFNCSGHTILMGLADKKEEPKARETKEMIPAFKKWFEKWSDVIITVGVVFIADHFVFGGKFRHSIEDMFQSLLNKAKNKVEAHEG